MNPFRPQSGIYYQQPPPLGRRLASAAARLAGKGIAYSVRTGYKNRNRLWPTITAASMLGTASYLAMWADGWKTALVLAAIAGAVLGWSQARAYRAAEAWAARSLAVSWLTWAATTAWTTIAAGVRPFTTPMPGILIAALVVTQLWWPIHQQLLKEHHDAEKSVADRAENLNDERVQLWVDNIACTGGALPGAQLLGVNDLADGRGWEAIITLPSHDAQNSETAVAAVRRIAKVYRVPAAQVVVEMDPDGMEDTARLLVLARNPLRKVQLVEQLTLNHETGEVRIGVHADGEPALWRLWTPDSGVCHGMVAGTTGAGKSGLLKILCTEIRHSGNSILMLADPEGGESCPDWADGGAHVFAGSIPRIRRMLQGAERIMKARKRRRSKHRWVDEKGRTRRGHGSFTPTPDEPAIYIVIDEAPDVLKDPECQRIINLIGKKGRKWGIAVLIFVQVPSLTELGGALTVRSMLSSTNIVIFRTSDSLSATMGVPMKLPIDPVNLPAQWPDGTTTAGLGYLPKVGGRVSPLRAGYQEDPYLWATTGEPATWNADDLAAGADEKGNYFVDWLDLLDVDDEEEELEAQERAASPNGYVVQVPAGTREKILAFLGERGELVKLSVIALAADASRSATSNVLKRLRLEGHVDSPRRGMWALTPSAAAARAEQEALVNA